MNKRNVMMTGLAALSMILSGTGLAGCSNQAESTPPTAQNNKKTKTLGTKSAESKSLKVTNKTGKPITVFEVKSSSDDSFGENLLTKGDVIKKGEKRVLYYETKDEDTLSIKVGLKDSDSAFTFDKVDETEKIQNVEISLSKENKVELTVNKKDDSKITIEASADETKTEDEKQNDEASESTTKAEESKTDSNESKLETKTDKTATTTSKTENKQSSSTNNTATSNKSNNSGSSNNSSSQQHTHNWVAQTKTVHHDEVGHYEQVEVGTIYYGGDPIVHNICNVCGLDLTSNNISAAAHAEQHALAGEGTGGHHSELVGYTEGHTETQYETKYVIDQQAYDETVTTGYKCSSCGATK